MAQSVTFDLIAHTFTIVYGPQSGGSPMTNKVVGGVIPAPLQAALENHAQAQIEIHEGWAANSSTVTTP